MMGVKASQGVSTTAIEQPGARAVPCLPRAHPGVFEVDVAQRSCDTLRVSRTAIDDVPCEPAKTWRALCKTESNLFARPCFDSGGLLLFNSVVIKAVGLFEGRPSLVIRNA